MLKNNKVQNTLADELTRQLSAKLQTKVTVGNVSYQYFNSFKLDSLYIEDQKKDTLLFVEKVYTNFDFWKFFKGKFVFNEIELNRLRGNLIIGSDSISNIDFIIQAFKSDKPKKESKVEFNFKDIKITDSNFKFYNLTHAANKNPKLFDGNRMVFSDINMHVNVDYLKKDSLFARINSLNLRERSGLQVKNLNTVIHGWKSGFYFPRLRMSLPNSSLALDSARMTYDSIANLSDILNKVKWTATIQPSKIALKDLSAFVPNLSTMKDIATIQGKLKGRISSFQVKDLELKYGRSLTLRTDVDMNGIPNIDETFIYAKIKDFHVNKGDAQDFISQLTGRPFVLPKELTRLGMVKYTGNVSGFFSNLVAYGNITTDVGSLNTDILLQLENKMRDVKYNGTIRSNSFQLGKLLGTNTLGKAAFKLNTKGSKLFNRSFQGTIQADVPEIFLNGYNYTNIALDGNYDGSGFDGKMDIKDKNLDAHFDGVVDMSEKLPVFNFDLLVNNADVHALNLTKTYEGSQLSFHGNTNMVGNSLDNLNGFLLLDNIRFENQDKELNLNQFLFESAVSGNSSKFTITSDLINGNFEGDFKYSTIPQTIMSFVKTYIPALAGVGNGKNGNSGKNYMDIDLTMSDTKQISDALNLPFTLDGYSTIKGYVDDVNNRMEINAQTPFLSFGKRKIQDIVLNMNNADKKLNVLASGYLNTNKQLVNFNVKAAAANDSLYTQFGWQNNDTINYAGELQAITKFEKVNDFVAAHIAVIPTQVIISDSIWDVMASNIDINPDSTFTLHNFKVQNNRQFINLDGIISKNTHDTLSVNMNEMNIGFILGLVNFNAITIDGNATGHANVYNVLKKPVFEADLFVKNAKLNEAPVGDARLHSAWDREHNALLASGTFLNGNDTVALADGMYVPQKDSLDFVFDAERLNLAFLQKYLGSIVQNVQGLGTGKVRMFGPSKQIQFEGNVYAENASVMVDYLKTTYSFTDTVYLKPTSISMKNIQVYDEEKNRGVLNGLITHDGSFKDMRYDVKINARNMMALNTKPQDNDYFYGKAYATGNVHIYGDEETSNIDVNADAQPKSKVFISLGSTSTANDNSFITFVSNSDTTAVKRNKLVAEDKGGVNLKMNLLMNVTPDADIQLIIDPKAGDMIAANGSGSLRLEYDDSNTDNMKLYGSYTIDEGYYLFTLQNLIRKQFKIDQGSSIAWSGDMFHAMVNIRAIYSVTASLRDLMDESIMQSTTRTSVPVDCILELTGDLMQPNIKFDVDLPSSDETMKMQVKNMMNTEELMNRQMMYLLLFGKFYSPQFAATDFGMTGNTISSFLSTTFFGQFNNWLSQATNNISFGANIRSTGAGANASQEYEAEILYQPNSRLVVNGNVGYRDDNLAKNKIIGDVDVEYILTENGKFRLKAFNHTVDKYTLRAAPFIQGLGVMYKETFNSWDELARHYWNVLNGTTKKKKADAAQTTQENQTNEKNK